MILKNILEYIEENNLKDAKNPQNINCDERLKEIFNVDQTTLFAIASKIGNHLT